MVALLLAIYVLMSKSKEIALPKMIVNKFSYKLYVVYHVCPVGSWASIVEEQINQFVNSGLYKAVDKIWICTSEPQQPAQKEQQPAQPAQPAESASAKVLNFIKKFNLNKIEVLFNSERHSWENETMNVLIDKSKQIVDAESEAFVLYVHNKASWHSNTRGQIWRHNMMLYIVEEWNRCAQLLEMGYKTVGPFHNWATRYYSGNFWWARASYLSNLERIEEGLDRGAAERFLLKGRLLDKQHANLKSVSILDHVLFEFGKGTILNI